MMSEERHGRVTYVIGPDGSPLTIADLPPPGTKRWVIRRKAEVVAAVRGGLLSLEEACTRYTLTVEDGLNISAKTIDDSTATSPTHTSTSTIVSARRISLSTPRAAARGRSHQSCRRG